MNTIDKYGDAAVIKAFINRNFTEVGNEFVDDVITTLKGYAFAGITDLKTLGIPSVAAISKGCFLNTQVSDSVDISWDKLTSIGANAFRGSNVIKESALVLPEVTQIGDGAFYGLNGITSVTADKWTDVDYGDGPEMSSGGVFQESSIQMISAPMVNSSRLGNSCFCNCTSLTSVSLPALEQGGYEMFYGCTALKEISLPSLTEIPYDKMFEECTALETVSMPMLTTIKGENTFAYCSALTSVSIPLVEGTLPHDTFFSCSVLETIDLPLVTEIGEYCFNSCKKLKEISIPNVTKLGDSAFTYCTGLASFSSPIITEIGSGVFSRCSALQTVDLPLVNTVGKNAFNMCSKVTKISLGGDIAAFGYRTFYQCRLLEALLLPGVTSVPTIESTTFGSATKMNNGTGVVYVPDALLDDFKADANWSKFTLQALSTYTEEEVSEANG